MLKTDFTDSGWWEELAKRHMTSYDLPKWHEVCSIEKMELWCDRLDLDYQAITNTTHQEFIELNPDWPLRAFVGLLLEQRDSDVADRKATPTG